jgi:CHAT domain-containing protein/tetratricopeptide (TPR) repeat protein
LRQLSLTYWEITGLQEFYSLNRDALAIAESINHRQEQTKCLDNLGLFYWKLDNYSEALKYLQRAYDLAVVIENPQSQAESLANIGIVYFDSGEYDKAMESLDKALSIDRKLANSADVAKDLINIGESYRLRGLLTANKSDFSHALASYRESLILANRTHDLSTEVTVLNNMGATFSHLESYRSALDFFFEALAKSSMTRNSEATGMILNNIGIVYSRLGNYEESTRYYQKAIDLALGISGGKILWEAYLEIADAYKKQGKWDAALDNYRKSISVIENIRSGLNLEELRATYLGSDRRIDAYYNIIGLYIQLYEKTGDKAYQSAAFNYLERAKARSFLDSMEVSKLNLSEGIDQKLLNSETELMDDISRIHTKLLIPQLSTEQRDSLTKELENRENRLDSLKGEIRQASPAYANLRYPTTVTLAEAQRDLIDPEVVCFAYLLGKDISYGFAISREGLKIFALPPRGEIQKLVQEHLRAITDPTNRDFRIAYRLFGLLMKPGLKRGTRRIMIVPDDALYFLPFETLVERAQGNQWLVKNYDVAYVPSLSSLRELLERKRNVARRPRKDILAIGDPNYGTGEVDASSTGGPSTAQNLSVGIGSQFYRLRYSGQEVAEIASLFSPKRRDVLVRDQATESNLKASNLSDYKILHFATHAVIDDQKPARSAIVLALRQDSSDDGFLQMREVFNLKLDADLVTLSACETGLGRLIRGEGIEGLSHAFFYAGASSVVLSLWAINDQASYQLLKRFYVHLRAASSVTDALRKAKIEMINSKVLDHPYYWAGFIATGETDKVIFPRALPRWIIALSVAAGLAILLTFISRDRLSSSSPRT